ncbi:hypothetical protein HNY73_008691 [Argiope bruennichi]|uniref:Uncharacterized protein n=1 Tax=Argiope bruennichi TaxID=94029 RepID=A0A8T0FA16_ARGBR|nr:hypothetical protein HNY73_008691 [Argiope bruennichi]
MKSSITVGGTGVQEAEGIDRPSDSEGAKETSGYGDPGSPEGPEGFEGTGREAGIDGVGAGGFSGGAGGTGITVVKSITVNGVRRPEDSSVVGGFVPRGVVMGSI